jgi:hypothetical protein
MIMRKAYKIVRKPDGKRDYMEYLGINRKIILELILRK